MREFEAASRPMDVHDLIAELDDRVDWVLVEGFKNSDLPKIEIWRAGPDGADDRPLRYPGDDFITAIATDAAARLPQPPTLPVLDLNDVDALMLYLVNHQDRFAYSRENRVTWT